MYNESNEALLNPKVNSLLDNVPAGTYLKDLEGKYLACNKPMLNLFGISDKNEIIGKTDSQLNWQRIYSKLNNHDQEIIETGKTIRSKETVILNGVEHIFTFVKSPLHHNNDTNNAIIGTSGVVADITACKLDFELAQKESLSSLEELKKDVLEPLTSISDSLAFLENVNEKDIDSEESTAHLERIKETVKNILDVLKKQI